jgi:DNA-binding FadR family transcriptional regulator
MPETLGVVSVQPGRGVLVAEERSRAPTGGRWRFGDRYALKEVFEIRRVIEGAAAALAVAHMDASDLSAVDTI